MTEGSRTGAEGRFSRLLPKPPREDESLQLGLLAGDVLVGSHGCYSNATFSVGFRGLDADRFLRPRCGVRLITEALAELSPPGRCHCLHSLAERGAPTGSGESRGRAPGGLTAKPVRRARPASVNAKFSGRLPPLPTRPNHVLTTASWSWCVSALPSPTSRWLISDIAATGRERPNALGDCAACATGAQGAVGLAGGQQRASSSPECRSDRGRVPPLRSHTRGGGQGPGRWMLTEGTERRRTEPASEGRRVLPGGTPLTRSAGGSGHPHPPPHYTPAPTR